MRHFVIKKKNLNSTMKSKRNLLNLNNPGKILNIISIILTYFKLQ